MVRATRWRWRDCRIPAMKMWSLGRSTPSSIKAATARPTTRPSSTVECGRVPAGYGEQAIRIQGGEKGLPTLDRIEPVLREREGAGTSGGPCVDHAHLDQVEFLLCPREPAPAVVDDEAHSRQVGDAGIAAQLGRIREEVDEDGIELDAGNVAEAKQIGRQHVTPAADTDDSGAPAVAGVVGEIGDVVAQEIQGARFF